MNSTSTPNSPLSNTLSTERSHRRQVQIPRIEFRSMGGSLRQRTPHACENCREKKAKCDGTRPICGPCRDAGRLCEYGEGKREKQRLRMEDLELKVKAYERLLGDLKKDVDSSKRERILRVMEDVRKPRKSRKSDNSKPQSISGSLNNSPGSVGTMASNSSPAFAYPNSNIGEDITMVETEDLPRGGEQHLIMDINTNSVNKPSGFMGSVSDESWISKIIDDLAQQPALQTPAYESLLMNADIREQTQEVTTYYVDDQDTIAIPENNIIAQEALPAEEVANKLVGIYFTTVQPLFPIIEKRHFLQEFHRHYKIFDAGQVQNYDRSFLCLLNLVFALGQTYSDLINDWSEERNTHIEYFFRARVLGALDGGLVYKVGTLQQIQIMGLSGLYCLGTKQANRAWNATGLAIRLAQGLGLHLRNEAPTLDNVQKEMRLRVWYSIHYLETTLCLLTGRPLGIRDWDCSSPAPRSIDDEMDDIYPEMDQPQDPFFLANQFISKIFAEVSTQLYSPRNNVSQSNDWSGTQRKMQKLEAMLDDWREGLPEDLQFLNENDELKSQPDVDQVFFDPDRPGGHMERESIGALFAVKRRMDLALLYYNVRILIHRPSVCVSDQSLSEQSPSIREYRNKSAADCVRCARQILRIMSVEPDLNKRLSTIPWWCFLHYFTAASAIIMSDVIYSTSGQNQLASQLMEEARNGLRWLAGVSKRNLAGRRCCIILSRILKLISVHIGQADQSEDLDEEICRAWNVVAGGDMMGGLEFRNAAAYVVPPLDFLNRLNIINEAQNDPTLQPDLNFFGMDWELNLNSTWES